MKRRDRLAIRRNQQVQQPPDRDAVLRSIADAAGPQEELAANPSGDRGTLALALGRDVHALSQRLPEAQFDVNMLREQLADVQRRLSEENKITESLRRDVHAMLTELRTSWWERWWRRIYGYIR